MRTSLAFASVLLLTVATEIVAWAGPTNSRTPSQATAGTSPAGAGFDIAPFGARMSYEDGKAPGVRWAEPRKVRRVVVEFAGNQALPEPSQVRLEYWHRVWDGKADPLNLERGAGGVGWDAVDDWTNGRWVKAQRPRRANRQRLRIHLCSHFLGGDPQVQGRRV